MTEKEVTGKDGVCCRMCLAVRERRLQREHGSEEIYCKIVLQSSVDTDSEYGGKCPWKQKEGIQE